MESKTTVDDLKKQLAATNDDLLATKTNMAKTNSNLASVTSTLAATNADLLSTKEKLQAASANFDILMQYPERFKSMHDDYQKTKQNLATVTSNLTATNADLATTKNDLATTNSKLGNLASTLTSANADLAATNNNLRTVKTDLAATIVDLATIKNSLTAVNSNIGLQTTVNAPPISFYVQRTSSFSTQNVPIPFDVERLNVGGAMNLTSGIFTAPRAGIYFFSFSGIGGSNRGLMDTALFVNSNRIGLGTLAHGVPHPTFSIQSTLQLNATDQVSVRIVYGSNVLYDDRRSFNHFTGFLIGAV